MHIYIRYFIICMTLYDDDNNNQLHQPTICRSIHYDLKESDIVTLFSSFGTITKSEMSMDSATGKSKGFCFLEYTDQASALAAHAMDGFELAGRKVMPICCGCYGCLFVWWMDGWVFGSI